MLGYSDSNQE